MNTIYKSGEDAKEGDLIWHIDLNCYAVVDGVVDTGDQHYYYSLLVEIVSGEFIGTVGFSDADNFKLVKRNGSEWLSWL